jgi:hypothetical protein
MQREAVRVQLQVGGLINRDRGHAEDVVRTALLQVARKWRRIRGEPWARGNMSGFILPAMPPNGL